MPTLLKPKDQKKKAKPISIQKDGREICTDSYFRTKRRWELYVIVTDVGGSCCFRCGCKLEFNQCFHAHHSRGTRGIGGGYRDDRIFVPGEQLAKDFEEYPYMPIPPEGMKWNLYALCNNCHLDKEHDQGCHGTLHWSGNAQDDTAASEAGDRTEEAGDQERAYSREDWDQL